MSGEAKWWYGLIKKTYEDNSSYAYYGLHEIYEHGSKPLSWTQEEVGFGGDSPEEVIQALEMAIADIKRGMIYEEDSKPQLRKVVDDTSSTTS